MNPQAGHYPEGVLDGTQQYIFIVHITHSGKCIKGTHLLCLGLLTIWPIAPEFPLPSSCLLASPALPLELPLAVSVGTSFLKEITLLHCMFHEEWLVNGYSCIKINLDLSPYILSLTTYISYHVFYQNQLQIACTYKCESKIIKVLERSLGEYLNDFERGRYFSGFLNE